MKEIALHYFTKHEQIKVTVHCIENITVPK